MTVKELIEKLSEIEDKNLIVEVTEMSYDDVLKELNEIVIEGTVKLF